MNAKALSLCYSFLMTVSETGIFICKFAKLYWMKANFKETKPYYFKGLSNLFLNTVLFYNNIVPVIQLVSESTKGSLVRQIRQGFYSRINMANPHIMWSFMYL